MNSQDVRIIFDDICDKYHFANGIMSLGTCFYWQRKFVKMIAKRSKKVENYIDLCAGTGSIALKLSTFVNLENITLVDISPMMIERAKKSFENKNVSCVVGDIQKLPFDDNSFDLATIAYGIRNVEDIRKALGEVGRVLKPKGLFAILELTKPTNSFAKFFHEKYVKFFIPYIGKMTTNHWQHYKYLSSSILNFCNVEEIVQMTTSLKLIDKKTIFCGIVTILLMEKL